ncbi:MAG: fibronectin type III domain-containing protein [Candidatus Cloacimonetes bacterium]|nr:fibronectin type III domain-containing protein [Candidatus Cloacimonadota bacterium]
MPIFNEGGAASPNGTATLTSPTTGIMINSGSANFSAIAANGSRTVSFSITASASMSIGTLVTLNFNASAGAYTATKTETMPVGLILEDFESGNFTSFPWIMTGNLPWTVVNTGAYEGTYTAKSGTISHNQTSTMSTTRILSSPGTISFRYKVSSESGYDYLRFYVDGVQQNQWSGTVDWTEATYNLAAGTRELSWTYYKDGSVSSGSDCAWIDYIVFPASTAPSAFYPPQDLTASPGNQRVVLSWQAPVSGTPNGYKVFRNNNLLSTVNNLSYTDTAVTNGVTYNYHIVAVYSGGESDPSNTVSATPSIVTPVVITIGSGTASTSTSDGSPINLYYKSLHGQSVYTAAELNAAGIFGPVEIAQIGF